MFKIVLSNRHISRLALTILLACVSLQTKAQGQRIPVFGSGGLVVTGNNATVDLQSKRLSVSLTITNNTDRTFRMFNSTPISALDNAGNSWRENSFNSYITGIYVCDTSSSCLNRDREQTETSATALEPGGTMTIILFMSSNTSIGRIGNLVSVGFSPMVQQISEVTGVDGRSLRGMDWHSRSLGVANIPLREAAAR